MNEESCTSLVKARAGGRCERCGGFGGLTRHHRKKRSQGGQWSPENIVLVCGHGTAGCHGWIENNADKAEAEGWHVRPWEEPDEVPIKLYRKDWFLLLPDGGVDESDAREADSETWIVSHEVLGEGEDGARRETPPDFDRVEAYPLPGEPF